jgi:FKBP-type peptidyl-prolyl cis-trans isomerase
MRWYLLFLLVLLAGCATDNACGGGSLSTTDTVVGSGTEAGAEDAVKFHFIAQDPTGIIFEQSYGGPAVEIRLLDSEGQSVFGRPGAAIVEGMVGMRDGGSRRLTIPADQAYGADYPSSCLSITYTIDLLAVTP